MLHKEGEHIPQQPYTQTDISHRSHRLKLNVLIGMFSFEPKYTLDYSVLQQRITVQFACAHLMKLVIKVRKYNPIPSFVIHPQGTVAALKDVEDCKNKKHEG